MVMMKMMNMINMMSYSIENDVLEYSSVYDRIFARMHGLDDNFSTVLVRPLVPPLVIP